LQEAVVSVPSVVRGRLTELRPAGEADAALLVAWHADPEVARFWDGETYTRDEILAEFADDHVDAWIVEAGGEPVGYLQSWWGDDAPRRGGLDMFLVPSARGRGLGPDAARAVAQSLVAAGWAEVTADPYLWNEQAVRAWQKAGFTPVEERPADAEHTAPWLLLCFEPGSAGCAEPGSRLSSRN
jgi:aminoglycoside 6'-N-acetyltransferase